MIMKSPHTEASVSFIVTLSICNIVLHPCRHGTTMGLFSLTELGQGVYENSICVIVNYKGVPESAK